MKLCNLLLGLSLPLFVFDQITKFWTIRRFPPPWSEGIHDFPVISNVFHLTRIHNQGVAAMLRLAFEHLWAEAKPYPGGA